MMRPSLSDFIAKFNATRGPSLTNLSVSPVPISEDDGDTPGDLPTPTAPPAAASPESGERSGAAASTSASDSPEVPFYCPVCEPQFIGYGEPRLCAMCADLQAEYDRQWRERQHAPRLNVGVVPTISADDEAAETVKHLGIVALLAIVLIGGYCMRSKVWDWFQISAASQSAGAVPFLSGGRK